MIPPCHFGECPLESMGIRASAEDCKECQRLALTEDGFYDMGR